MVELSAGTSPAVSVVTGGAGFLGSRLIAALLSSQGPSARVVCVDRAVSPIDDGRVTSVVGDVADPETLREALTADVGAVWHLAAVLSGQSEAEPGEAWRVNVAGTGALLEGCGRLPAPPRFVLASTIAVFGGPLPDVIPNDLALRPQSTYGMTKAVAELLVLEATRRGQVDGVVVRVPTVAIRPGQPNSAMSSFVSGIVREPLRGVDSLCPVPLDTKLWVSAPSTTTRNLLHAGRIDAAALGGDRTVNLPGLTVTPGDLLASLERAGGAEVRARVRVQPDPLVSRAVGSWPGAFDETRAHTLGFVSDTSADALVAEFIADRG